MKIGVVDDSAFSRKQVKKALKNYFGEVDFVEFADGASALEGLPGSGVEIVTLDLVMPEPNGLEVLRSLKKSGFEAPIFIVSADIQESTKASCNEAGCSGFIEKPMNKDRLQEVFSAAGV